MPNIFGDPSPQEVLAQIAAEGQQAISQARDPQERRNAMMFAFGRYMASGQDPRYIAATKVDSALKQSVAIEREEGESALDFELRRGKALYGLIKDVDSSAAYEVASRIVTLEQEKEEQRRLKVEEDLAQAQETRTQEAHESNQEAMRRAAANAQFDGVRYAYDPQKRALVPGAWEHIADPASQLRMADWRDKGLLPVTPREALDLNLSTAAADADIAGGTDFGTGSTYATHAATISAAVEQAVLATEITAGLNDAMEAGINPSTRLESPIRSIQSLANAAQELHRAANLDASGQLDPNYVPTPMPGTREFAEEEAKVTEALNRRGLKTSIPASLLTLYIYASAKSQDARVTNMDYQTMEARISAAVGNPAEIYQTIAKDLEIRRKTLLRTVETMSRDIAQNGNPEGKNQANIILGLIARLDESIAELDAQGARMQNFQKRMEPVATPSGESYVPGSLRFEGENQ